MISVVLLLCLLWNQAKERAARRRFRRGEGDICSTDTRSFMSMSLGLHLYFVWLVGCSQRFSQCFFFRFCFLRV